MVFKLPKIIGKLKILALVVWKELEFSSYGLKFDNHPYDFR